MRRFKFRDIEILYDWRIVAVTEDEIRERMKEELEADYDDIQNDPTLLLCLEEKVRDFVADRVRQSFKVLKGSKGCIEYVDSDQ